METSVEISTIKEILEKNIKLEHQNIEQLLFLFLEELIYLKDAELLIFSKCNLSIEKNPSTSSYLLSAVLIGQEFNEEISTITDVKAVTFYQFNVKQSEEGWKARVTFDL
jgi:SHS2 domain-containing protein